MEDGGIISEIGDLVGLRGLFRDNGPSICKCGGIGGSEMGKDHFKGDQELSLFTTLLRSAATLDAEVVG